MAHEREWTVAVERVQADAQLIERDVDRVAPASPSQLDGLLRIDELELALGDARCCLLRGDGRPTREEHRPAPRHVGLSAEVWAARSTTVDRRRRTSLAVLASSSFVDDREHLLGVDGGDVRLSRFFVDDDVAR